MKKRLCLKLYRKWVQAYKTAAAADVRPVCPIPKHQRERMNRRHFRYFWCGGRGVLQTGHASALAATNIRELVRRTPRRVIVQAKR